MGVLLAAAGWSVIGVEPDQRMAVIARSRGLAVVVSRFEQWTPPRSDFDLVAAGTAWHWVDPKIGYRNAASALRAGGHLAIFRNSYRYDTDVAAIIHHSLRRHAPHLLADCVPLGTADPSHFDSHGQEVERRSDLFAGPETRSFSHERVLPVKDWIEELATHSPVMLLDGTLAAGLLADLTRQVLSEVGDNVRISHETHCLLARRR